MQEKSLTKNAVWNFLYNGLTIIFPLITAPYVSRVLGAENLGKVDFARSFVLWFITFATFGVNTYGVREIAKIRRNNLKMSKLFSELFTLNLIFTILSTVAYLIIILSNERFRSDLPLFFIMSISIILNVFNIDWFYQGIEEYGYITIRNGLIKLLSFVSMFIFVINEGDYIIYGLISILGTSLSGILNLLHSKKYVNYSLNNIKVWKHCRYLVIFYLITLVISLYTNLDLTLLGFLDIPQSVAFLARTKMMISVAGTMSTSITAVAMPRASYYMKNDLKMYKKLIIQVPEYMLLLTIPTTMGVIYLAPEILYILGGEEFSPSITLMRIISITIIFSSLSTFLNQQIIVPTGNERYSLLASVLSSIVSVIANIILIPRYSFIGAGVALTSAEFIAVFTRSIIVKKLGVDYVKFINITSVKYAIAALLMGIPIFLIKDTLDNSFLVVSLSVLFGVVTYFFVLYIFKEKNSIYIFTEFRKKIGLKIKP